MQVVCNPLQVDTPTITISLLPPIGDVEIDQHLRLKRLARDLRGAPESPNIISLNE